MTHDAEADADAGADPGLTETLLSADQARREELLRDTPSAQLEAAFLALGHRRDQSAAEVLAVADAVVQDRALRKVARRELHRLRSMGIVPPESTPAPSTASTTPTRQPEITSIESWVSDYDPNGARVAWLLGERRLGGVWFGALVLNDLLGITEMNVIDTTRKRFERDFDESRRQLARFIPVPPEYALRLVREGADLARENGGVPPRYRAFRDVFGEADGPPERPLAHETINPVEATFNPDWLEQSASLLGEPEVAGWHVTVSNDFRTRALEAARASGAGLVVPGHAPEQQALQVVADAGAQAITPAVRRGFRRRLEETASIFLATDRLQAARRAVAAARALEDEKQPIERHPLMRLLVASGLARLLGGESVAGRRAGEVLIDLVERAADQSTTSAVETRPSGLILPR